jgi:hypothetical protein
MTVIVMVIPISTWGLALFLQSNQQHYPNQQHNHRGLQVNDTVSDDKGQWLPPQLTLAGGVQVGGVRVCGKGILVALVQHSSE